MKVWGNAGHLRQIQSQIIEELNIKQLTVIENFDDEAKVYYDGVRTAQETRANGEFTGHGLQQVDDYWVSVEPGCLVALDTRVSPELADEGMAREIAHRIQGLRPHGPVRTDRPHSNLLPGTR